METITYPDFSTAVENFFQKYLARECGASKHTIRSYRDCFVLLLEFFETAKNIKSVKISLELFTRETVSEFLDWLEDDMGVSVSTRNQRGAALKSFLKFLVYEDPTHMAQWQNAASIKPKKAVKETMAYLVPEGIAAILSQIDTATAEGRRDLAVLATLYYTAARVGELTLLTASSVRIENPGSVELFGKGAKKRLVPIPKELKPVLKSYIEENRLDSPEKGDNPLFFNCWGEHLTAAGVNYILKKHASAAHKLNPELVPESISAHKIRHSRAMHLLQAGVNLVYIRDILGHVSVQTTEIYARADSRAKKEALENAYVDVGVTEPEVKPWAKNEKLKAFLRGLA